MSFLGSLTGSSQKKRINQSYDAADKPLATSKTNAATFR